MSSNLYTLFIVSLLLGYHSSSIMTPPLENIMMGIYGKCSVLKDAPFVPFGKCQKDGSVGGIKNMDQVIPKYLLRLEKILEGDEW